MNFNLASTMWKGFLILPLVGFFAQTPVFAEGEGEDLFDLPFEDLLNVTVVTASKSSESLSDAPGIITTVSAAEIRRFGANNLKEVLDRVTSTYVVGSYFLPEGFVSMRGNSKDHYNNHVLMLINGRPYRDTTQGGVDANLIQTFPIESIDRIEIIRGPGSVLYGTNAYTSVVNLITKKGGDAAGNSVTVGGGSFETYYANASTGTTVGEDLDVYVNGRYTSEDGFGYDTLDEAAIQVDQDLGNRGASVFTSLDYDETVTLNFFYSDLDQDMLGVIPFAPLETGEHERYFVDLGFNHDISDDWSVNANVTFNSQTFDFPFRPIPAPLVAVVGDRGTTHNTSDNYVYEVTTRYTPTEDWSFMFGGVADNRTGNTFGGDGYSDPASILANIPRYNEIWWSGYGQADYRVTEMVKLVLGGQYNKPERIDADFVPRYGALFTFDENWGAKLLYGEAFRAPNQLERTLKSPVLVGAPGLEPETIATLEAQVDYRTSEFQVALTGFSSEQDELIARGPNPAGGPITHLNKGGLDSRGIELESKYYPSSNLSLTGSFTYRENEDDQDVEDYTLMPSWMGKIGASYIMDTGITFGVFGNYITEFESTTTTNPLSREINEEADEVFLVSAKAEMDLQKVCDWNDIPKTFVSIYGANIFDQDVYMAELVRRNINTLPLDGGAAVYGELRVEF